MKVFVTGITGFIAEGLVPALQAKGHEVSGLVRYVSTRDAHALEEMLPGVEIHFGDMTDPDSLETALQRAKPEAIINMAAQTSVEYSFQHLKEIYDVDFIGTVNLSLAAKKVLPDLQKFVQISSVETYGNQKQLPLREDMKLAPAAPYGVAKAAGEYHLNYLFDAFAFPAVILRNANSYGRKRNKNFVVEHIIANLLGNQKEVKMGNRDAQRDFYYIDDEVDFFVKALELAPPGETINSGTTYPISIGELYEMLEETLGIHKTVRWNSFSPRANEIRILTMDISKAKVLLDWEPKTPLDEGLKKTAEYWQGIRVGPY